VVCAVCASSAAAFGPASSVGLLATTSSSWRSCARPQKALVMSAQKSEANISRRGALAAVALSVVPAICSAEEERPLIPESEMIKPPKNSCEQGGEKE